MKNKVQGGPKKGGVGSYHDTGAPNRRSLGSVPDMYNLFDFHGLLFKDILRPRSSWVSIFPRKKTQDLDFFIFQKKNFPEAGARAYASCGHAGGLSFV